MSRSLYQFKNAKYTTRAQVEFEEMIDNSENIPIFKKVCYREMTKTWLPLFFFYKNGKGEMG